MKTFATIAALAAILTFGGRASAQNCCGQVLQAPVQQTRIFVPYASTGCPTAQFQQFAQPYQHGAQFQQFAAQPCQAAGLNAYAGGFNNFAQGGYGGFNQFATGYGGFPIGFNVGGFGHGVGVHHGIGGIRRFGFNGVGVGGFGGGVIGGGGTPIFIQPQPLFGFNIGIGGRGGIRRVRR